MFIDHLGYAIFNKFSFFNYIGRVAFPIFAFQISEGFHYTKNVKKYFARLLLFAIFSQIPFMLFLSIFSNNIYKLNVFFTLFLGLFSIYIYDKIINSFYITSNVKLNNFLKFVLGISIVLFIGFIAEFLKSDYGLFGIAVIFLFYLFKNNKIAMTPSTRRPFWAASSAVTPPTRWKTTPTVPPATFCATTPSGWSVCAPRSAISVWKPAAPAPGHWQGR